MHKISKGDVVGFLCQIGGIAKSDIGLIEVKDRASFAAVKTPLASKTIQKCDQEKMKKVKVLVDYA